MLDATRQINQLITLSQDLDKDKRYMAAADLCEIMLREDLKIDLSLEKQVCQVFVNQLDDSSSQVSGNAVKCLSQVMNRIQEQQVSEIIQKVMQHLLEEKTTLSIYSTCAKQVVGDISQNYAFVVIKSFMPNIVKGLKLKQLEPRQDSIEILTDILRRFGPIIASNPTIMNVEAIQDLLFEQLAHPNHSIRRRATATFAALSAILSNAKITELVQSLFSGAQKSSRNPLFEITYLQSIAAISRTVPFKMSATVKMLVHILLKTCNINAKDIDPGDSEGNDLIYSRIVECLSIIEQMIHGCPRQMGPFIQDIVSLVVTKLLAFDPNMQEGMEEQGEEEGWGEEWDDEDDFADDLDDIDTSWKLRKAAVKIIVSIVKSRPELLRRLYKTDVVLSMVNRMNEREEAVKRDIMVAFAGLIASVKRHNQLEGGDGEEQKEGLPSLTRQESSIQDLTQHVPQIVKALSTQLQKSKHFSPYSKIKEGILEVYQAMAGALAQQMSLSFGSVLPDLFSLFKENSIQIKVGVLDTVAKLFQKTPHSGYIINESEAILSLFHNGMKDSYYEVQAATMTTISHFADMLFREATGPAPIITELYKLVKEKFKQNAVDKSVKISAIVAMSSLLAHFSAQIGKTETDASLGIMVERAFNEGTWLNALQGLHRLAESPCDVSRSLDNIVSGLVELMDKRTGTYKFEVYKTLIAYLTAHQVKATTAGKVTQAVVKDIAPEDFQISSSALKLINAVVSKRKDTAAILGGALDTLVQRMVAINGDGLINEEQLESIVNLFSTLAAQKVSHPVKALHKRATELGANLKAISQSLATIHAHLSPKDQKGMLAENFSTIEERINALSKAGSQIGLQSTPVKELVLSLHLVGDIGKRTDLSGYEKQITHIHSLFSSQIEEVRTAASRCVGCVTLGNLNHFLPKLTTMLTSKKYSQYLLLEALREVSSDSSSALRAEIPKILPLLRLHANSDNEHVQDIVAQNLGRIYASNAPLISKEIFDLLQKGSENQRATAALSFKFAVSGEMRKSIESVALFFSSEVLSEIMYALESDKYFQVRKNILLSFYSLLNVLHTPDVRGVIREGQKHIYKQTVVIPELIKEVDLGPFKHKVDKGTPLRRAAFECMEVMLELYYEKLDLTTYGEVVVSGLKDKAEEVKMKCLEILVKLIKVMPDAVMSILDRFLVEATEYLNFLEKQLAVGSDRQLSLAAMRMLLRTVLAWSRVKNIEQHRGFQEFMQKRVMSGKDAKHVFDELYHKA